MRGERGGHNMDGCLTELGSLGRYQVLQLLAIVLGTVGAAYQLMGNIFIGREFSRHQCFSPDNDTATSQWPHDDVMWNSSDVMEYGQCEITVSSDNSSEEDSRVYACLFGYTYDLDRHLSFRTEFDLVCEHKLLGSLVQTLVILGQGFGAVIASIISDRYGRKPVLVASQLALLTLGLAAAFVPSYAGLAVLKFVLGAFQQGVITTKATLSLEWFPAEQRSLVSVVDPTAWSLCMMSMALVAYLMRFHSWRHLQIVLSAASIPVFLFQLWYVDESPRWLMANNRREAAVRVLKRAARANGKDVDTVLQSLPACSTHQELQVLTKDDEEEADSTSTDMTSENDDVEVKTGGGRGEGEESEKLTLPDLFRHRRLLLNSAIMWAAWFACAFAFFALYMMSTSLHGNRFLNFFLTALMELIPGFIFYFLVDRVGRKLAIRPLFAVAGVGLVSSGVCRIFTDKPALKTLSVVMSMLGMIGASGMFSALFFYTPECFPTNIRNQALGVSSFASRFGGMLAPFMVDLAEVAVWAPGAMIGSLCFLVVALMHFLPETKGRELPDTVQDIERWYQPRHTVEEPQPQGQKSEDNNTDSRGSLSHGDPSL